MSIKRRLFLAWLGVVVAAAAWAIVQVIDRSIWWQANRPTSGGASLFWNMAAVGAMLALWGFIDPYLGVPELGEE